MILDVSLQFSIQVWKSTMISKQGYPCKYILQWMSVEDDYPRMDIHVFMGISLQLFPFRHLLISMNIDIELLWILDPGL